MTWDVTLNVLCSGNPAAADNSLVEIGTNTFEKRMIPQMMMTFCRMNNIEVVIICQKEEGGVK